MRSIIPVLLAACLGAAETGHPMLLWDAAELAKLRERVTSDPLGKQQLERALAADAKASPVMVRLMRYALLGDQAAGQAELKSLRNFFGKQPPANGEGDPRKRNAAWRDDRAIEALRYDILQDLLTDADRAAFRATAASYVQWCIANPGPWRIGDPGKGFKGLPVSERGGWLPNMQWTTMSGTFVLAAATRDPALIEQIFNADGGFKWYFDQYLTDGRWYQEEFGKYPSNTGSMILYCEGLERLGLGRMGYGYTGTGGATMRRYVEHQIMAALPRMQVAEDRWDFPVLHMGDAGGAWLLGFAGRKGKDAAAPPVANRWYKAGMQGDYERMAPPLWWEAAHRRWPDGGFGWFLGEMREPGEELYFPSVYFGLPPVDPKQQRPPPAPSSVNVQRGFALLRADESPAYWTSPAPAVSFQFALRYVHYVHDAFCLLDFVAGNRRIYGKQGGTAGGYAGGDPWRNHQRGQGGGLTVDGLRAVPVEDDGLGGTKTRVRGEVRGSAKFAAVRADGVFPEATLERGMVLTADYLVDISWLSSPRPRLYDWHVNAYGRTPSGQLAAWATGADLAPHLPMPKADKPADVRDGDDADKPPPKDPPKDPPKPPVDLAALVAATARHRAVGDATWSEEIRLQPSDAPVGDATPGVRIHMLGAPNTTLIQYVPPGVSVDGTGVQLMASRTAASTCFAVVHEPLAGAPKLTAIERLAETAEGTALRIRGAGIDDRIVVRTGADVVRPAVFAGDGASLTVSDWCWVRVAGEAVTVVGGCTALSLPVTGSPRLVVNGAPQIAAMQNGVLTWSAR